MLESGGGCALQLCKGATAQERQQWQLADGVQHYTYLRASGCWEIAGVDDAAEFLQVKHSLNVVGIDQKAQVGTAPQREHQGGALERWEERLLQTMCDALSPAHAAA